MQVSICVRYTWQGIWSSVSHGSFEARCYMLYETMFARQPESGEAPALFPLAVPNAPYLDKFATASTILAVSPLSWSPEPRLPSPFNPICAESVPPIPKTAFPSPLVPETETVAMFAEDNDWTKVRFVFFNKHDYLLKKQSSCSRYRKQNILCVTFSPKTFLVSVPCLLVKATKIVAKSFLFGFPQRQRTVPDCKTTFREGDEDKIFNVFCTLLVESRAQLDVLQCQVEKDLLH